MVWQQDCGKSTSMLHVPRDFLTICSTLHSQRDTGEDRAEGASFWYAFLTPFWSRKNIFFSKETMLKPMSDLSQIQDEPSKSLD